MATPSELLLGRIKRAYNPEESSSDLSLVDAKRLRRTQADSGRTKLVPAADNENALPLRRRVNPDSLAVRLPANLVLELDALISPDHTDMPTFAVRKELQERYDIDRRHIYDYLHSKGLRVVKEDRISNLVRGKRSQSSQRSQSPQYPRKTPVDGPQRVVSATPTLTKLPTNRKTVKSCGPISASSSPSDSVAASCFSPNAYNFVNPLDHPFQNVQSGNSLDDGSFPTRTAGDIDPYRSQHMSEQVSELDSFKTSITITSSISPQDSRPPLFLPSDQITPSQGERMSFYNILNDILGPAHGLQESVGTYKAHMGEQTRRYFERLFPTSPSLNKHRSIYPIRSNLEPAPRADFSVDFRKWLLCGKTPFSSVRAASDSPQALVAQNPVLQQDSTTSTCNTPLFSPEVGPGSDTLDDLFPPLPLLQSSCIQDTIGSPVLRSKAMRRLRLSPPLEEQNLMISRVRSTGPPVAKENASYPGLAVPTSRLSSREKVYFLPTPSSSLLLSRSLCDDCVEAAMPSLTAQISAEPRKTHGHRGAIHDPAASPSGRYCAVTLKQVTELETGRIKRSDRMRTTSAGGGI